MTKKVSLLFPVSDCCSTVSCDPGLRGGYHAGHGGQRTAIDRPAYHYLHAMLTSLAHLSSMLDKEINFIMINVFVVLKYLYCPLGVAICVVYLSINRSKNQEREFCYVLNDFNNTYSNLLHRASKSILYLTRLRFLAIEIYKTLNDMSPLYMKMFSFERRLPMDLGMYIFLYNRSLKQSLIVIFLLDTSEVSYGLIYLMSSLNSMSSLNVKYRNGLQLIV